MALPRSHPVPRRQGARITTPSGDPAATITSVRTMAGHRQGDCLPIGRTVGACEPFRAPSAPAPRRHTSTSGSGRSGTGGAGGCPADRDLYTKTGACRKTLLSQTISVAARAHDLFRNRSGHHSASAARTRWRQDGQSCRDGRRHGPALASGRAASRAPSAILNSRMNTCAPSNTTRSARPWMPWPGARPTSGHWPAVSGSPPRHPMPLSMATALWRQPARAI